MMTSLSLTITSPQKEQMGAMGTKTFGCEGGTIGRAVRNDWILPEETVSSQHALISFQDGEFIITDLSTNGVFINESKEPLGNGNSAPLGSVQTLSMGRYTIAVSIDAGIAAPEAPHLQAEDHFSASAPVSEPSFLDDSSNDPMDLLGSGKTNEALSGAASLPEDLFGDSDKVHISQDQQAFENAPAPSVQDAFIPPSTHSEAVTSGSAIPDNWDQTCFSPAIKPETVQTSSEAARQAFSAASKEVDIASQQTLYNSAIQAQPLAPDPLAPVSGSEDADRTNENPVVQPCEAGAREANVDRYNDTSLNRAKTAFQQNGLDASLLDNPDLVDQCLALFPLMLEGMLATLRSRSEVKNELRASQTILQSVENNPLKFSTNAADAFHNLLISQRPGFLSPEESVRQAFEDLTRHEAALVLGIQAGLNGMLEKISPEAIEAKISHLESKKNLFGKISSSKKWAYYKETYQHITENSEHSFIDMFGDDFVKGYEAFISNQKKNGK